MDKLKYRRNLPHIHPPGETLFVTFRTADSLLPAVLKQWKAEAYREQRIIDASGKTGDQKQEALRLHRKRSFARFEALLDTTAPPKYRLDQPVVAAEIDKVLLWQQHQGNFRLLAYCIMPNHVHVVVELPEQQALPFFQKMNQIKAFSAKQINKRLGRNGSFWQREYYDHVVRNGQELERIIAYVLENPVKAGLCATWREWPYTYLAEDL